MPKLVIEHKQLFNVKINCDDVYCIKCPIKKLCETQETDRTFDDLESAIEHYMFLDSYLNEGSD